MVAHHPHDAKWIEGVINQLPEHLWAKAADGYDSAFREAYHAEPDDMLKVGAARRAANTRLRRYVAAIKNAAQGGAKGEA